MSVDILICKVVDAKHVLFRDLLRRETPDGLYRRLRPQGPEGRSIWAFKQDLLLLLIDPGAGSINVMGPESGSPNEQFERDLTTVLTLELSSRP